MNWVVVFAVIVFKSVNISYLYDEEFWEIEVYGRKEKKYGRAKTEKKI